MNRWKLPAYITSCLFPVTLSGVNGSSGTLRSKQILQMALKEKETNSLSYIYYLDEFDRYMSNLFLGTNINK